MLNVFPKKCCPAFTFFAKVKIMKRFILSSMLPFFTAAAVYAQSFTVPENYQQVYSWNIPTSVNYGNSSPTYDVNNSAQQFGVVESIGYHLQLNDQWVWVSMDAFTSDLTKIGVPTVSSGAVFQTKVSNLQYQSNVASLGNSNASTAGNIEFWPNTYNQGNTQNVPGADGGKYDFGDNITNGSYGSMQVHDYGNGKTVFGINKWNTNGNTDLGIGNASRADASDWTFAENAGNYSTKVLGVYVKPLEFAAAAGSSQADVIAKDTQGMNIVYKMDIPKSGGLSTANYVMNNEKSVSQTLKGMPLTVGYYLEMTKADGSKDYVYTSMDGLTNDVTKTGFPFQEQANQWHFQKNVQNMTVQSNVAGVTNGTNIQTGNVEIWNTDYAKGSDNAFNYADQKNNNGSYGSFQIHNSGAQQTVFAVNNWKGAPEVGIGNCPNPYDGGYDWTFNSRLNANSNLNQYESVNLYVMAKAAIAPMMANVADGAEYSIVQGHKITASMNTNLHTNGTPYDIVNNVSQMQNDGVIFDRIGYYMEYAETVDSPLQYVFVSMDAFTDDISKIGVPDVKSGIFYQQQVRNMNVTSNVSGVANGTGINGAIEFWPSNYGQAVTNVHTAGNGAIYDTNDSGASLAQGHGSMQVHNIDANQTVFAYNHFSGVKQYGIGNNTGNKDGHTDWTFDETKKNYAIANIYTFVRESDAVLFTTSSSGLDFYQRDGNNMANITLSGSFKVADGVNLTAIQASEDGQNWIDMQYNAETGEFSSTVSAGAGWHQYQFRAMSGDTVLTSSVGDRIGVGDIFITAGQSNSTNHGDAPTASTTGNVVSMNHETGEWGYANDPQPTKINGASDNSNKGSTWPSMGDALSEMTGVPVAFSSVGWGGTSINWWDPDADNESNVGHGFDRLQAAIENLDGNFTAILWHQGESDFNMAKETYQAGLEELILASREVAGWDVPWEIALVSWRPQDGEHENIRDAQIAVTEELDGVFLGPDSDALLGLLRGQNSGNGIHFSVAGLEQLGQLWAWEVGRDILGVPEPSTWVLFIGTFAGLGFIQFRKKRAKTA